MGVRPVKYTVCVDFDGVLHTYDGRYEGDHIAEGLPIEGAIGWLFEAVQHFEVVILTTRGGSWRGRRAIRRWLRKHSGDIFYDGPGYRGIKDVKITNRKPPALMYIDDRAVRFTGEYWPNPREVHRARPWWKT